MSLQYHVDDSNRDRNGKYIIKGKLENINTSSFRFTTDVISLKKMYDEYTIEDDDNLTEEEITQIDKNRKEIKEGKARSFENIDEYIKSLDEE